MTPLTRFAVIRNLCYRKERGVLMCLPRLLELT